MCRRSIPRCRSTARRKADHPLKLNLTTQEKADLVLFLRALNDEPLEPLVRDPDRFPQM
jgi:hypothetical protein